MPAKKRQHFVPKGYLRLFSDDGVLINVFNLKRELSILRAGLAGQCYGDWFYDKDTSIEDTLGDVESKCFPLLRRIIDTGVIPVKGSDERADLVFFMALQHLRTAFTVDAMNDMVIETKRIAGELYPNHKPLPAEGFKNASMKGIGVATTHFWMLFDLRWRSIRFDTVGDLITSDQPTVFYNQCLEPVNEHNHMGFETRGLQIFLPIGPKHALMLYDPACYGVGAKDSDLVVTRDESDVEQMNRLQAVSAYENIYFGGDHRTVERLFAATKSRRRASLNQYYTKPLPTSHLIGHSRVDVRTNLSLTFVRTLTKAKQWRQALIKGGGGPMRMPRDPQLSDHHDAFCRFVKEGRWDPKRFLKFCVAREGHLRSRQAA